MTELEQIRAAVEALIELRFERANNRMRYGTGDPTGGTLPYPTTLSRALRMENR